RRIPVPRWHRCRRHGNRTGRWRYRPPIPTRPPRWRAAMSLPALISNAVITFSQAGAATSMHTNCDTTTIDVAGANLAAAQARRLDVKSYATPVRSVNTHAVPGGARIDVETRGVVQTASYQTGNQYVVEFSRPTSSETTALGAPKP